MKRRRLGLSGPLDLAATLRPIKGAHSPAISLGAREAWVATRSPDGPVSVRVRLEGDEVEAEAWGPGSGWALERLPDLLGFEDDPQSFVPNNRGLAELHRRHLGMRFGSTGRVMEALLPAILGQKVSSKEAKDSLWTLVRRYGDPAPGPVEMRLIPSAETLAELPYFEFHPLGIERRRAEIIRNVSRRADRLERISDSDEAGRVLQALPGIGPWTSAVVRIVAFGDPDAVLMGDYHLPNTVAWALAGEPRGDDARMLELLEPYRGHRARVIRLLAVAGIKAPRYGPRSPTRSIAGI